MRKAEPSHSSGVFLEGFFGTVIPYPEMCSRPRRDRTDRPPDDVTWRHSLPLARMFCQPPDKQRDGLGFFEGEGFL